MRTSTSNRRVAAILLAFVAAFCAGAVLITRNVAMDPLDVLLVPGSPERGTILFLLIAAATTAAGATLLLSRLRFTRTQRLPFLVLGGVLATAGSIFAEVAAMGCMVPLWFLFRWSRAREA